MADFSQLGIPSREWINLANTIPRVSTGCAPGQTIEDLQQTTNAAREAASARFLETSSIFHQLHWTDIQIPTRDGTAIPARVYKSNNGSADDSPCPVYLFFHGGGFLFGTLSSEDANCARLATALPIIVVHVCYRHTPRFRHPTQAHDASDAFDWLCAHAQDIGGDPRRLIIGGVSAGGSLAAAVTLAETKRSRGKGRIRGQVLCIPWLYHPEAYPYDLLASKECSSHTQNSEAPILPRTQVDLFLDLLGVVDLMDTSIFAGHATNRDVVGMPKSVFIVAGMDPLRDDALLYAEKLKANGQVFHFYN
jgi:acetyl esterase/lipase